MTCPSSHDECPFARGGGGVGAARGLRGGLVQDEHWLAKMMRRRRPMIGVHHV